MTKATTIETLGPCQRGGSECEGTATQLLKTHEGANPKRWTVCGPCCAELVKFDRCNSGSCTGRAVRHGRCEAHGGKRQAWNPPPVDPNANQPIPPPTRTKPAPLPPRTGHPPRKAPRPTTKPKKAPKPTTKPKKAPMTPLTDAAILKAVGVLQPVTARGLGEALKTTNIYRRLNKLVADGRVRQEGQAKIGKVKVATYVLAKTRPAPAPKPEPAPQPAPERPIRLPAPPTTDEPPRDPAKHTPPGRMEGPVLVPAPPLPVEPRVVATEALTPLLDAAGAPKGLPPALRVAWVCGRLSALEESHARPGSA